MLEFQVGEHRYRARKMNAFQQFHVGRRLAPLISEVLTMGELLAEAGLTGEPGAEGEPRPIDYTKLIVPFADGLSRVSDEDCNYVLGLCLSMVQRQQGGNGAGLIWSDVWNARAKQIMFEDINSMPPMMEIVIHVLQDNMAGFFGGGQVVQAGATIAQTPTLESVG